MTMTQWLFLLGAILVLSLVMFKTTERFQPEFLDKSQVAKTVAVEDSSYAQTTNHMMHAPADMGPVQGIETPFRVNQYTSYVV
jgi:hypothetical protein